MSPVVPSLRKTVLYAGSIRQWLHTDGWSNRRKVGASDANPTTTARPRNPPATRHLVFRTRTTSGQWLEHLLVRSRAVQGWFLWNVSPETQFLSNHILRTS